MLKMEVCKSEDGSIMIEAAIIFPIILLVLLTLITLSIIVHDVYVSELIISTFDKNSHSHNIEKEIRNSMIANNVIKGINVSEHENLEDYKNKKAVIESEIEYKIPIIGDWKSVISIKKSNERLIQKIMLMEMTGDVFDDLTLTKLGKDKYKNLIKTVLSGLEND